MPPPASAETILVHDLAETNRLKERKERMNSPTKVKVKKQKQVFKERFQCPIPKDSQHAVDLFTAMKDENFEIIEKKIRSADIMPLMSNPKALRKALSRLKITTEEPQLKTRSRSPRKNSLKTVDQTKSSTSSIAPRRPPSRSSAVVRPKSTNQQNRLANSRSISSTPQDYYSGSSIPSRPSTSMSVYTRPSTVGEGHSNKDESLTSLQEQLRGRKTIRSAGRRRNRKRPRQRLRREYGQRRNVPKDGRPLSGPERARLRLQDRYRRFTESPIGKKRKGYEI